MSGLKRYRSWLEPIEYHQGPKGWVASARHVAAEASSKGAARLKLYRAHRRLHRRLASEVFRDVPVL